MLSLVLAAGFACLLAGFVWIEFAVVFGLIVEMFSWTIFGVVKLCSLVPGGSTRIASPPLWVLGLEALAIALIWWRPLSIHKLASFAAIAVFAGAVLLSGRPPARRGWAGYVERAQVLYAHRARLAAGGPKGLL